jgi:hypothetical protein
MIGGPPMSTIDVVDLKTLRQKYLKRKLSLDRFPKGVWADCNQETGELFLEFSHLVKWSGEEYTYTISLVLDADRIIRKISALKCQRLAGDDARGSSYRGKRTDEYDYYRLDCILRDAVEAV